MMDEGWSPQAMWWSVGMTLTGHAGGRSCPQCGPDGCAQLAWAVRVREAGPPISPVPVLLAGARP
ncbi:hypothetical protein ACIBF5_26625 [Micromonospora sp. NPDC050417]|uniref:hypothetical protein n=1 Tax=Micromonospora sp. NPDC050417 TaxID=3364280 RepID=UPI00379E5B9F